MVSRSVSCGSITWVLAAVVAVLTVRIPAAWGQSDELDVLLGGEQAEPEAKKPGEAGPEAAKPAAAEPKAGEPRAAEPETKTAEAAKPAEAKPAEAKPEPTEAVRRRVGPAQAIEEIIVTARKTEENIQDVPVAVTALTPQTLEQTSSFDTIDLQTRTPSMTVRPQSTAVVFQMRGQAQTDVLGTLDPSVALYDDGVYVARPFGSNASFVDVKSVQVLRGPQGTLFGRNTTGGAILLSTNDPDFQEVSGSLSALVGNLGRKTFSGVLNLPLFKDRLAFRAVGQTQSTEGFAFDETNQRKIATEGNDLVRVKLLYQPFDGLSFLLAGQYIDTDQLAHPVKPIFALKPQQAQNPSGACCLASLNATAQGVDFDSFIGGDPDRVSYDAGLKPVLTLTVKTLTLTTVWDQPWATIKFIGGIRKNEHVTNRLDVDGTPSKIVDTLQANRNRQGSGELQLTGSWLDDRLKWAAGTYYFDESGNETGTTSALIPVAAAINPIITVGDIDNKSAGGYAQATYALLPKLRVTGGLRYSWDDKRLVLHSTEGPACALPSDKQDPGANCQGTFDDSFTNLSYTAGTDYRLLEDAWSFDDLLIYTSVTTGYRAGGQNLRGTSDATLAPFKPETLMQFEAGFKSEFLDRHVRLNGAGYHTLYHDVQRTIIVASQSILPAQLVSNAASATITGAEIELSALPPISGLDFGASLGITLPKYNKFIDATGDRTDEKFDEVAKTDYSLSAAYMRELLGVMWLNRLDWAWKDEIPLGQGGLKYFRGQGIDLEPRVTLPATGILNARTALTFGNGMELGLFGKNLTDERRFYALVLGGGPDFAQKFIWDPGREYGLDLTVRF